MHISATRGPSRNSYGISDDDVSSSDAIDEENSIQVSGFHIVKQVNITLGSLAGNPSPPHRV